MPLPGEFDVGSVSIAGGFGAAVRFPSRLRREATVASLIRTLWEGVRGALRRPALLVLMGLPIAVGIGTLASILTVARDTVLSDLPFSHADQLVDVRGQNNRNPGDPWAVSYPDLLEWERAARGALTLGAYSGSRPFNLEFRGAGVAVTGEFVSSGYFPALSAPPHRGRYFGPAEDLPGNAAQVVVVSESLWRTRLGGKEDVLGAVVQVGGVPLQVVGVAPPGFRGLNAGTDLWMPVPAAGLLWGPEFVNRRSLRWLVSVGRLKDGTTMKVASELLSGAARELEETFPEVDRDLGVMVRPLQGQYLPDLRATLASLAAGATLLLLLVTANVAALMLVDALERAPDFTVRFALGAEGKDQVGLVLGRALALTLPGGLLGALVGVFAGGPLLRFSQVELPAVWNPGPTLGAVFVPVCVVALVGAMAGVAPALLLRNPSVSNRTRSGLSVGVARTFRWLSAFQVALALVLTCGALTVARSLRSLMATDLGFSTDRIATLRIATSDRRFRDQDEFGAFLRELQETVAETPGVANASLSGPALPGDAMNGARVLSQAQWEEGSETPTLIRLLYVTPGTLDLLGISLAKGRAFDGRDQVPGGARTVIVSQDLTDRFWPGEDPVGQRMRLASGLDAWEVVGVATPALLEGALSERSKAPFAYFPLSQASSGIIPVVNVIARASRGDGSALLEPLRRAVQARFPSLDPYDPASLQDRLDRQMASALFLALLITLFAALSAVVAVLGTFASFSQMMVQHTREFGLRLALGSSPAQVRRLALGKGVRPGVAGLGVGLLLAGALSVTFPAMAVWAKPAEPEDLLLSAGILALGIVLGILPALRGVGADPRVILSGE